MKLTIFSQQREKNITKKDNERQRNDIDINETKFFLSQEKKCVAYPHEDFLFMKLITSLE
jgi:hypothetical protein